MNFMDGLFVMLFLLVFAIISWMAYERQNGFIGAAAPEPTVMRQLDACGKQLREKEYQLATALQSVEVWRDVASKQKAALVQLAEALENCRGGDG